MHYFKHAQVSVITQADILPLHGIYGNRDTKVTWSKQSFVILGWFWTSPKIPMEDREHILEMFTRSAIFLCQNGEKTTQL